MTTATPTYGPAEGITVTALKDCITQDEAGALHVKDMRHRFWDIDSPEKWAEAFMRTEPDMMVVNGNLLAFRRISHWRARRPEQAYGPDRLDVKTLPIDETGTALDANKATITAYQEQVKQYRKDGWTVHFLYRSADGDISYVYGDCSRLFCYTTQRVGKIGNTKLIKASETEGTSTFLCYGYIAISPDVVDDEANSDSWSNDHVDRIVAHVLAGQKGEPALNDFAGAVVVNLTSGMIAYGYRSVKDFTAHVDQLPDAFWADPDEDADAALTTWEARGQAKIAERRYENGVSAVKNLHKQIDYQERRIRVLQAELVEFRRMLAAAEDALPELEQVKDATRAATVIPAKARYRLDATDLTAHLA